MAHNPYTAGRKRRRSASPYERERYDPRPRYEDYGEFPIYPNCLKKSESFSDGYRGHGHSPSRGRGSYGHGYGPRSGRGAPPPDPHSMDYPATLKQYADWFRYNFPQQASEEDSADKAAEQEAGDGSKPRNGIRTRWEKYKKEFLAQQVSHSRTILNQLSISALFLNNYFVNTMYTESVLYCSFRLCLTITESLLGLQRSMILHQNLQT